MERNKERNKETNKKTKKQKNQKKPKKTKKQKKKFLPILEYFLHFQVIHQKRIPQFPVLDGLFQWKPFWLEGD